MVRVITRELRERSVISRVFADSRSNTHHRYYSGMGLETEQLRNTSFVHAVLVACGVHSQGAFVEVSMDLVSVVSYG